MFENLKRKCSFVSLIQCIPTNKVNLDDGVSAYQGQFEGMTNPKSERAFSFTD